MKKNKPMLIFEQLEERIFLDANPMLALVPAADGLEHLAGPLESAAETAATEQEATASAPEPDANQELPIGSVNNRETAGSKEPEQEEPEQDEPEQDEESAEAVGDVSAAAPEAELAAADEIQGSPANPGEADAGTAADNLLLAPDPAAVDLALPLAAADGLVVLDPVDPLIGEDFTFSYTFANSGAIGFGPFVDIYFPTFGLQGDHPSSLGDVYDGIAFVSASYEGSPLTAIEQTFDASGQVEHPYLKDPSGTSPLIVTGREGDTFVTLELPFGSFTAQQPPADIVVTAHMSNLAEVNQPLEITTQAGFRFGSDPLDNPQSDPPYVNQSPVTTPYLPEVIRFEKTNTAPENETATGPNYVRTYDIAIDVATGMTVDEVRLLDRLSRDVVLVSSSSGGIVAGNNLLIDLGPITGVAGVDRTVSIQFYVEDVLGEFCENSVEVTNDVTIFAVWDPFDDRDPVIDPLIIDAEVDGNGNISPTPDIDDILEAQPITIRKSATDINGGVLTPGDIVRYTLDFEISDYHALGNIEISDLLPDGVSLNNQVGFEPEFSIQDQYGSYNNIDFISGSGTDAEFQITDLGATTGIDILVSQALLRAGDADGILEGGRTPGGSGGPARGTITYYGLIDDLYANGEPIFQGDSFTNSVTVSADRFIYPGGTLNPFFPICSIIDADGSDATVSIPVGGVDKSVYALNGTTVTPGEQVVIRPGDEVTYRLQYTLPTSDFADLVLVDYLPLPIFTVTDPDSDGSTDTWVFNSTISADSPAPGVAKFGPSETFFDYSGLSPALTANGGQNTLIFDWDFNTDPRHEGQTVDLLFTVVVTNDPFADGLFLTNLVEGTETGTSGSSSSTDTVQVILAQPELTITKGVIQVSDLGQTDATFTDPTGPVAFTAPGSTGFRPVGQVTESGLDATAIDADLEFIDAGDLVSFAITVRNVGRFEAYDILVKDDIPDGFAIPTTGLNLNVSYGDGITLVPNSGDLFGGGLKIGTIGPNVDANPDQTNNILLITYDLVALNTVQPQQEMLNTAVLDNYASIPGGPNFVPEGLEDPALVTVTESELAKEFITTEIIDAGSGPGFNEIDEAVIGERVYYEVQFTLAEGTTNASILTDQLDRGLELASIDSITILDQNGAPRPAGTVTSSIWGDFSTFAPLTGPGAFLGYTYNATGPSSFTLDLGNLINTDTANATDEILVIGYTAMVVNDSGNVQGTQLNNSATLSYQALPPTGAATESLGPAAADPVTVIEPALKVVKTSVVDGVQSGPSSQWDSQTDPDFVAGQQNSAVTYFISIEHDDPSAATAFDVIVDDQIPFQVQATGLTLDKALLTRTDGTTEDLIGSSIVLLGRSLSTIGPIDLDYGDTVEIEISGFLLPTLVAGNDFINRADIEWTSYDGKPDTSGFVSSADDAERTGDPADPGQLNDYNDWDPTQILLEPLVYKFLVNSEIDRTEEPDAVDYEDTLLPPNDSDGINKGREAVIGELVHYQADIVLPELFNLNLTLIDTLDQGLTLVSIDSIAQTSGSMLFVGNDALLTRDWSTAPFDDPGDPLNQFITYSEGSRQLSVNFGSVGNNISSPGETEIITINYTAMVTDVAGNAGNGPGVQGTRLNNGVFLDFLTGVTSPVSRADTVEVLEPDLDIVKELTTIDGPGDAGDRVTYTVTVQHSADSEADAYDLGFVDRISKEELQNLTIVSADIDGTPVLSAFQIFDAGADWLITTDTSWNGSAPPLGNDLLDLDISDGDVLTLVFTGIIVDTVQPGDMLDNRAIVSWTSTDGARTDYSLFQNDGIDRKRVYEDAAESDLIVVPAPAVAKELVGTDVTDSANGNTEATIGEIITYEVTVTLTEGVTGAAVIVDQLGPGLEFVDLVSVAPSSASVITTDLTGGFGAVSAVVAGDAAGGQTVSFALGTLTVAGDNTGEKPSTVGDGLQGDDRLVITYRAGVAYIPANDAIDSAAEQFVNSASFTYVNNSGNQQTAPASADPVTLVEPELDIVKRVNGLPDGTALADVDAGDPVRYSVVIQHTAASGSAAYDTLLSDRLPPEFVFASIGTVIDLGPLAAGQSRLDAVDFAVSPGNVLQFAIGGNLLNDTYDIEVGRLIVVNVLGSLSATVQPNQAIDNVAAADWTSLPEGHENDGLESERGLPYDDDIYHAEDGARIEIAVPEIEKSGGGTLTIGETASFTIAVELPEGQIRDLVVTDALPDGLVLIGAPLVSGDPGIVFTAPVITTDGGDGNDVVFDFSQAVQPSISVAADNDQDNNTLLFTFEVQVENVAGNTEGGILINFGALTYTDGNGAAQSAGPDSAAIILVEPQITTTKQVVDESGNTAVERLQERLTYTARFTNTGTSTAYEVTIEDLMAPGTGFVSVDSVTYYDTLSAAGIDITAATSLVETGDAATGITLSFGAAAGTTSWDIRPRDYIEIVYTAEVLGSWFDSGEHVNVIDADWTGLAGSSNPMERIYDDTDARNPGQSQDGTQDTAVAVYFTPTLGVGGGLSLGDTVWFDAIPNGIQEANEPGLANVTVTARVEVGGDILFSATRVTDAAGFYEFTRLRAAPYTVTVDATTLPGGTVPSYDLNGGTASPDGSTLVTLAASGDDRDDVDFGYTGIGSLGDRVWFDQNADGVQDVAEPGIPGAALAILGDLDGDGSFEFSAQTITETDGIYSFTNLPFVDFVVQVDPLTLPTFAAIPTYDFVNGIANPQFFAPVTLPLGGDTDPRIVDFGAAGTGTIGNFIWNDIDADGVWDPSEPGLDGIRVILEGDVTGDGVADFTFETITAAMATPDENYLFTNLPGADYTLFVDTSTLPAGFIQSADPEGRDNMDNMSRLTISAQQAVNLDQDFGYTKTGSIGDFIWYDADADGVQDTNEPGLAGVGVTLVGDIDLDGSADTLTAVTDASGRYLFDGLPKGSYTVTVNPATLPAGMAPSYDLDGIATANRASAALDPSVGNRFDFDFGYTGTGAIGDTIWNDANRNGVQNAGEPGIPGVVIELSGDYTGDGVADFTLTATTDAGGTYLFTNLPAGRYTLAVDPATIPAGLGQTFDPDGLLDSATTLILGAGATNLDQDFGYAAPLKPELPRPPAKPQPPQPPETIVPEPGDPLLAYQFSESAADRLVFPVVDNDGQVLPAVPISPVYSGTAEPGTTLTLVIRDGSGEAVAYRTIIAGPAGNWLSGFTGSLLDDSTHQIHIGQVAAAHNNSSSGLFNTRVYFNPAMTGLHQSSTVLDTESIFSATAEQILHSLEQWNRSLFDLEWDKFSGYEFFSPSINPAQHKR